ncbi:hypothetical protein DPMN_098017 [Dreissena polymorpha]|uniref:HAT C-terminal dimerisation domain-containing protein n=1 Tax=Dreissena polymorpha TaxID=45954 RepID=A0A9D4R6W1_DREPO|nr:hypothetical protein DPMN_098017 [Dreissena polymorpha]
MEEIKQLATHFVRHISKVEDVITEFMLYKRLVKGSYSNFSVVQVTTILMKAGDLPNMTALLKCCIVISMTSVQCERGFSTQNRIKSKYRTSMKESTLVDLMRISEDGPKLRNFDFNRALAIIMEGEESENCLKFEETLKEIR